MDPNEDVLEEHPDREFNRKNITTFKQFTGDTNTTPRK